ncbi:unnamed protein product [Parnassius apollo]|uniref:(apollo) hypothetical protein n=1 Tax=Parnassius apollo TaxID=110799 RepID=A0A8S3WRJ6_PARAO|nr:unnamed protein product [Parnassius apollo]
MRTSSVPIILAIGLVVATALPEKQERIVGGAETTIENYPYISAILFSPNYADYIQVCVGNVLNNRAILTVAHCFYGIEALIRWRIRVGSSYANSGGNVHYPSRIIIHPNFSRPGFENDIAILHSVYPFSFSNSVSAASIAGVNYNPGDDQVVYNVGWGKESVDQPNSEQLRSLQVLTINYNTCINIYIPVAIYPTENVICSGWHDSSSGANQCQGPSGSPLVHNGVIIGLYSFGWQCTYANYPAINTKVSSYTSWIVSNA